MINVRKIGRGGSRFMRPTLFGFPGSDVKMKWTNSNGSFKRGFSIVCDDLFHSFGPIVEDIRSSWEVRNQYIDRDLLTTECVVSEKMINIHLFVKYFESTILIGISVRTVGFAKVWTLV
jgi:hypothetical protein